MPLLHQHVLEVVALDVVLLLRQLGLEGVAQRRPLVKEIEQLERKLAKWNEEKAALETLFANPEFYATVDRVKSEEMHRQAGLLGEQIDEAEMRWLEVHEALEALPSVE